MKGDLMSISERLSALRCEMKRNGVDMYYIPTDDYHGSEYVCGHFKCREFISGFTGSAGTVIVTDSYAGLWTDGRYFIQAEKQLSGSEHVLNKSGEHGVLSPTEFILKNLGEGVLGFDGKTVSASFAEKIISEVGKEHILSIDLIDNIWKDRPDLPCEKGFYLDEKYSGKSCEDKLAEIRRLIADAHGDIFLLSSPDDICWLLNVRGNDIPYNPVILSYAAVSEDSVVWFMDENKLTPEITENLNGVEIRPYDAFYDFIANIPSDKTVILDKSRLNFEAVNRLPDVVKVIDRQNLTLLPKARKNETEINNERAAHIKDGVAVTKFIYEVKNHPEKYTELSAAKLIISLRSMQEGYIEESFEPIIAYGEHGAIVHYSADENSDCPLKREGFLLCDTGGHYLEGTTDITRTICLGAPTDEMKQAYTAVLRGHLSLADARFRYGCHGANLDILARAPLWELGMDFNHGTGHGVGYLLNVHESPNGIRNRFIPAHDCVLEEGMITSDEPGVYIEGKFGIRTESLILCRKGEKTDFGQFMYFENLTLVPFDPDAVDISQMTAHDIRLYNEYQQRVYDVISPLLTADERDWLREQTRPLSE